MKGDRIILKESLSEDIPENVTDEQVLAALPGLHAFTGCDAVSAFSRKGKVKALKIMFFESIGGGWTTSDEIYSCTEEFVSHLYGILQNILRKVWEM